MDGALGFNTFEKQDKVLVGLNGGMDATVTVRILQEQGFAVQAALVHFAGMADDAVETAQNAAKALDVTLHVIEAADTAADELLKFQLLMQTADKLDCRFISTGHYARVEQDAVTGKWKLKKARFLPDDIIHRITDAVFFNPDNSVAVCQPFSAPKSAALLQALRAPHGGIVALIEMVNLFSLCAQLLHQRRENAILIPLHSDA